MAPSRKTQSEVDRLRSEAEDLWDNQKEVLERANRVLRDASRHARRQAAARGHDVLDNRVRPAVASGFAAGRGAASAGRERLVDDVFPVVSSALGSALAILDAARNPEVRAALSRASSMGRRAASRVGIVKEKSSPGPGRYILIGVGVVALAGVAYAAWQTLRADDDLWIDDDELTEQTGEAQPS